MTKLEAIKALTKGKKIRQTTWDKEEYIVLNKAGNIVDEKLHNIDINCYSLYKNWEIYKEPKVKYYKYAFTSNNKDWQETIYFYRDKNHMKANFSFTKAISLDTTMIEVDLEEE
jgi:hypothetical protein